MRCFICHSEGADIKIPNDPWMGEQRIHKDCLAVNLSRASSDTKKRELLKGIIEFEANKPGHAWQAGDVGAQKQELTPLVKMGILGIPFKTNRFTSYKLTSPELAREILSEGAARVETRTAEIPDNIFAPIAGYDDVKKFMTRTLRKQARVHWLLVGPPATAKSSFEWCIDAALGGPPATYLANGSRTTAPGLVEALMSYRPSVLLFDELDDADPKAFAVLLDLMERGNVSETIHRRLQSIKLDTAVIGACNETRRLPQRLLSRFEAVYFKPYSRDEFIDACEACLSHFEGAGRDIARYIGERIWDELPQMRDVRRSRGIYRMLEDYTRQEVDEIIQFRKNRSFSGP